MSPQDSTGAPTPSSKISVKLLQVQKSITSIAKDANNDFKNFEYVSANQVNNIMRQKLSDAGLILSSSMTGIEQLSDILVYTIQFTFTDVDTGEITTRQWIQTAKKMTDVFYISGNVSTYARKYFLISEFMIPISDQNDPDALGSKAGQVKSDSTEFRNAMLKLYDELGIVKEEFGNVCMQITGKQLWSDTTYTYQQASQLVRNKYNANNDDEPTPPPTPSSNGASSNGTSKSAIRGSNGNGATKNSKPSCAFKNATTRKIAVADAQVKVQASNEVNDTAASYVDAMQAQDAEIMQSEESQYETQDTSMASAIHDVKPSLEADLQAVVDSNHVAEVRNFEIRKGGGYWGMFDLNGHHAHVYIDSKQFSMIKKIGYKIKRSTDKARHSADPVKITLKLSDDKTHFVAGWIKPHISHKKKEGKKATRILLCQRDALVAGDRIESRGIRESDDNGTENPSKQSGIYPATERKLGLS